MKRIISFILIIIMLAATAATVSAGGHHNKNKSEVKYSVCNIESCLKTELHAHKGKNYTAHYYRDGHDYHDYCAVKNCGLTGYHEHDGVFCFSSKAKKGCC